MIAYLFFLNSCLERINAILLNKKLLLKGENPISYGSLNSFGSVLKKELISLKILFSMAGVWLDSSSSLILWP